MDVDENDGIYQLYTIISDPNGLGQNNQDQPIILLTIKNDRETEDEQTVADEIEDKIEETQETPPVLSNLKLITLNDGRVYVTATNNDEEDLETVEPHLITSTPEDMLQEDPTDAITEQLEDINKTMDNNEYQEIELEDGTHAIFNINLMEPLEKVEEKSPPEKQLLKYQCVYKNCGKICTTAHHLRVHIRSHTGLRPYHCDVAECGKSFTTGYSLKAHMRTHTGEKPYGCSLCDKHFKTSGDLQKHIRIHTGEKPFKCPIENCGRSFTTSNIRKVHIRSHTGERPYSCQYRNCGKAFASATNYKNHMRIHSGEKPYVCQVEGCGRRFTEYSSLYKHNSVHQPYKPYICTYCGQQCKQESTLKAHKRAIHNVVIIEDGTEIMVTQETDLTNLLLEVTNNTEENEGDYLYLQTNPEGNN